MQDYTQVTWRLYRIGGYHPIWRRKWRMKCTLGLRGFRKQPISWSQTPGIVIIESTKWEIVKIMVPFLGPLN